MDIVNLTNTYQAYIILYSISPEYEYFVLVPALAIFIASLVLTIIYMLKENTAHVDLSDTMTNEFRDSSIRTLKRNLVTALSAQDNVKQLVSNLEDLKSRNIISEEAYNTNKNKYDSMTGDTNSAISAIKARIKDELKSKENRLSDFQKKLEQNEKDYGIGSINKSRYQANARRITKEINRSESEIANLRKLSDAGGIYDAASVPD